MWQRQVNQSIFEWQSIMQHCWRNPFRTCRCISLHWSGPGIQMWPWWSECMATLASVPRKCSVEYRNQKEENKQHFVVFLFSKFKFFFAPLYSLKKSYRPTGHLPLPSELGSFSSFIPHTVPCGLGYQFKVQGYFIDAEWVSGIFTNRWTFTKSTW